MTRESGEHALSVPSWGRTLAPNGGKNGGHVKPHNEAHCLIVGIAPHEGGLLLALTDAFSELIPIPDIIGFVPSK